MQFDLLKKLEKQSKRGKVKMRKVHLNYVKYDKKNLKHNLKNL
jgi:hypothetical protein